MLTVQSNLYHCEYQVNERCNNSEEIFIQIPRNENGLNSSKLLKGRAKGFHRALVELVLWKHEEFLDFGFHSHLSTLRHTPFMSGKTSAQSKRGKLTPQNGKDDLLSRQNYKYSEQSTWHFAFKWNKVRVNIDQRVLNKFVHRAKKHKKKIISFLNTPNLIRKVVKEVKESLDPETNTPFSEANLSTQDTSRRWDSERESVHEFSGDFDTQSLESLETNELEKYQELDFISDIMTRKPGLPESYYQLKCARSSNKSIRVNPPKKLDKPRSQRDNPTLKRIMMSLKKQFQSESKLKLPFVQVVKHIKEKCKALNLSEEEIQGYLCFILERCEGWLKAFKTSKNKTFLVKNKNKNFWECQKSVLL